jgi:vanadium chloroperoxidase
MDAILYWNDVALEADRTSCATGGDGHLGCTLGSSALALVHLAMYEAYAGVRGNPPHLPPYLPGIPPPDPGASVEAAVAAAAYATLSHLFPCQQPFFEARHLQARLRGPGISEGHTFGLIVAERMLEDREQRHRRQERRQAVAARRREKLERRSLLGRHPVPPKP